jgi:hypothetical protein
MTRSDTASTAIRIGDRDRDSVARHLRRRDLQRLAARRRAARPSVGAWYFWPIWPIIGAGIGLVAHGLSIRCALSAADGG